MNNWPWVYNYKFVVLAFGEKTTTQKAHHREPRDSLSTNAIFAASRNPPGKPEAKSGDLEDLSSSRWTSKTGPLRAFLHVQGTRKRRMNLSIHQSIDESIYQLNNQWINLLIHEPFNERITKTYSAFFGNGRFAGAGWRLVTRRGVCAPAVFSFFFPWKL